jgi:c-di-GMP-binding flagellar brake protein YcgR
MSATRRQHVTVRVAELEPLPATVEHVDEDTLVLALLVMPDARVRALHDRPVCVEYTTPRGVHRLTASLSGSRERPEVLTLRRTGHDDVVQRRDWFRVDAVVPVTLIPRDGTRRRAPASTLNVSGGGMLVSDPLALALEAELDVELHADSGPPVRARCRVVREAGEAAKGLRILEMDAADRRRLSRLVTDRERMALRIARSR